VTDRNQMQRASVIRPVEAFVAAIATLACNAFCQAQSLQLIANPFPNFFSRVAVHADAQGTEPDGFYDVVASELFPTALPFITTDHIEDHDPLARPLTGNATCDATYTFTADRLLVSFSHNRFSPEVTDGIAPARVRTEGRIFFIVDQPVECKFSWDLHGSGQGSNQHTMFRAIEQFPGEIIIAGGGWYGFSNEWTSTGRSCHVLLQPNVVYAMTYGMETRSLGASGFPSGPCGATETGFIAIELCCYGCGADVDASGLVDNADLLDVISNWGACPPPCPTHCPADVNRDCQVSVQDLLFVIGHWGLEQ